MACLDSGKRFIESERKACGSIRHERLSRDTVILHRPLAPFYVQLDVTNACNHKCFFCYNASSSVCSVMGSAAELNADEVLRVIDELSAAGVISINFNGGEPLARRDFFELAEHAAGLGLELHLNTNATLINEECADRIAGLFPSACTSVLAASAAKHDQLVGVSGAFGAMRRGVDLLLARGVKVEILVCALRENYQELYEIARVMVADGIHAFCVVRYISVNSAERDQVLGAKESIAVLDALERIRDSFPTYLEVKLSDPIPFCEIPPEHIERLKQWSTPCQVGYGLCRISAQGIVTPCTISSEIMGDLRRSSFQEIWRDGAWSKFERCEHLPVDCRACDELDGCRGGCIGYDDCRELIEKRPAQRGLFTLANLRTGR